MIYFIAEIGFNHDGDLDLAEKMIEAAAKSGVNAVKFQTFRAIDIALPTSPHFEMIRTGEMNLDDHLRLNKIAQNHGVDFLSTPFSKWGVDLLEEVSVPAYKVASMDCTNKPLLGHISQTGKPIYLSTGMAELSEIADTLSFLRDKKSGPVTLMHCLSLYPAKAEDLNFDVIPFLKKLFGIPVGYSDHYPGTDACLVSALLGANVVETHFTLDSSRTEGDHFHSVEPDELKRLIDTVLLVEKMRGHTEAIYNRPDRQMAAQYRRGVYSAKDLPKGHRIIEEDLILTRPVSDFTPDDLEKLIGKELKRDVPAYQGIRWDDIFNK